MAAFLYARQSDVTNDKRTGEEADTLSLEAQVTACRNHAERNGWLVANVYSEQFSGFAEQRTQYQRMLRDIKANHRQHPVGDPKRIVQVVIYKYARLSRDPGTLTSTVAMLRAAGVEVEPASDQKLGTGKLDELMLFTLATFGRIQVQDATEHAMAARKSLQDKGLLVMNGRARYGYRYDRATRTRVIDEPAAAVVRRIFGWFAEGCSAHKVVNLLRAEGTPSPSGKPVWTLKTVRDLIRDESYKGSPMMTGKTERLPGNEYYKSGGKKFRKTAEATPVGEGTPAIVTEAVWEQANAKARDRSKPTLPHREDWLVGYVWCGACGIRLGRFNHKHRGYHYWRCRNHQQYKTCGNQLGHVLDSYVREPVNEQLAEFLADPSIREAKLAQLAEILADPQWKEEDDRNRAEISRLRDKMAKLLARFGDDDDLAEMLATQVQELKSQIGALESRCEFLASKVAESRRAGEAVEKVRGLLGPWPVELVTGPDGPAAFEVLSKEDKRLVADTVGLRVVIERAQDEAQWHVQINVFDYEWVIGYSMDRLPPDTSLG